MWGQIVMKDLVGGPIDGAIADVLGARAPLVVGGIASLAAAAWGYRAYRRAT